MYERESGEVCMCTYLSRYAGMIPRVTFCVTDMVALHKVYIIKTGRFPLWQKVSEV